MTGPRFVVADPEPRDGLPMLLERFGVRARIRGKSQAQIAWDAWLDDSYVSRLLRGQRQHPSRDALILLAAFGLELPVEEVDEVLMAADYRPLVLPATLR